MSFLNKLRSAFEYSKLMGLDWLLFRIRYELLKKIHYFDRVNKTILQRTSETDKNIFSYKRIGLIKDHFSADESFIEKANNAINGKIFAFSNQYLDYNENGKINWQMNPLSKIYADKTLSWNTLPDFGEYGDIKLIWEASRFPQVYFFIHAFTLTENKKYATACLDQILDWIKDNPYPKGVNYKCGQEITFRIFAWINALEYFKEFLSPNEEEKIIENIYISLLRIEANIDYASKSVKNNHSVSEAAGLLIGGLLFPQFPESNRLINKGLQYLLNETSYQVYPDGSYIQHSFTYQRLALDVLSFVFLIAEKTNFKLPDILKKRHYKMIEFLNSFMQENGWLPNYGSNDGANLFPIENRNYRDFRTSLDFARGKSNFFDTQDRTYNLKKEIKFSDGGYYILKDNHLFTFIRCHSYKDRPAQNDMFHIDIWHENKNIFCDAGSYSYNTDTKFKNNFIGVPGHNTVMLNNSNHMRQVLNFGYTNWTKAKCLHFDKNCFKGINYAYEKQYGILHERTVTLNNDKIQIIDKLENVSSTTNIKQIWNTKYDVIVIDETTLQIENCFITSNVAYHIEDNYISDYYNTYTTGKRIIFTVESEKETEIITSLEFRS